MELTVENAKIIVEEVIVKTKKSLERESSVLKELEDDRAALSHIVHLQDSGEPLAENSPYTSYAEWEKQIEKEIDSSENSLNRIAIEKAELIAFEYFMENAQVV